MILQRWHGIDSRTENMRMIDFSSNVVVLMINLVLFTQYG